MCGPQLIELSPAVFFKFKLYLFLLPEVVQVVWNYFIQRFPNYFTSYLVPKQITLISWNAIGTQCHHNTFFDVIMRMAHKVRQRVGKLTRISWITMLNAFLGVREVFALSLFQSIKLCESIHSQNPLHTESQHILCVHSFIVYNKCDCSDDVGTFSFGFSSESFSCVLQMPKKEEITKRLNDLSNSLLTCDWSSSSSSSSFCVLPSGRVWLCITRSCVCECVIAWVWVESINKWKKENIDEGKNRKQSGKIEHKW